MRLNDFGIQDIIESLEPATSTRRHGSSFKDAAIYPTSFFFWLSEWRRCAVATGQVSGRHNMQGVDIVNEPLFVKDGHSVLADEYELGVRHLEFLTVRCPNRKWPEPTPFNPVL